MSTLCWLIEVIFLLEFYYYLYFLFIYIRELSWRHGASMSIHSVINKGINIEGCKIPTGSEPINKEHKAVKQHSGPIIYLGKDNESKLIIIM